jgi:hypothetical protein
MELARFAASAYTPICHLSCKASGICVVYNEILQLSYLLVVVWFLILHMHRASIVYVLDIELQTGH